MISSTRVAYTISQLRIVYISSFLEFGDFNESYGIQCHCQLLSVNQIQRNRVIEILVIPLQSETLIQTLKSEFEKAPSQDTTVHSRVSAFLKHFYRVHYSFCIGNGSKSEVLEYSLCNWNSFFYKRAGSGNQVTFGIFYFHFLRRGRLCSSKGGDATPVPWHNQ